MRCAKSKIVFGKYMYSIRVHLSTCASSCENNKICTKSQIITFKAYEFLTADVKHICGFTELLTLRQQLCICIIFFFYTVGKVP